MIGTQAGEFEQARRLERGLILVRWLGVILGLYLVSQTNTGNPQFFLRASSLRVGLGYGIMGTLAISNLVIWKLTVRARDTATLKRIGFAAFLVDAAVLLGLSWLYSYDPRGDTWVVIYILPLEGAIRYRLEGALISVGITLLSEIAREAYLASTFADQGYDFLFSNVAFVVGIQALIALVAGFTARSLAREAENASEQAVRFQEAAQRESMARRELAAFNTAILTGVAAEDLDSSIQLMAGAIGRDLEFETFTILLRDGEDLVVKGTYGLPFYEERIAAGDGVTGAVAASGQPIVVPDVRSFPSYIQVDPGMRSEMAAPLRIGEEIIGVIDVESRTVDAFDDAATRVLGRLADQVALVIHSARLYATQRETLERLRELDQMKSDFVAIASHELRTPLTAIHGYVRTLARRYENLSSDEVQHFLATISRQSARMTRLVEDLLFVSKIEAGALRVHLEEVDLAASIEGTVESLGQVERTRIQAHMQTGNGSVRIDPEKTGQILRNLLGNALKFSPPDSPVQLGARVDDGHVELSVSDQGVGIATEDLPFIFDRFHQASEVMTRTAEGAGLGLYITKRLIEALGGTIEVRSAPGRGSTFTVRLPQMEVPDPAQDASRSAHPSASGSGVSPSANRR